MTKIRVLASMAAVGLAATAQAQSSPSINSVAFVPVTIPANGGAVMVGVNLEKIDGEESISAVDLFGSNQLVRANSALFATQIHAWNGTQYVTLYQRLDGRYRLASGAYTNYQFRTGDAVWLQSPSTSTAPHTIYLVGQILPGPAVQREMIDGIMLIANPFASPWYLNGTNMTWVLDGAKRGSVGSADNIYIWNGASYDQYYLRNANSNWVSAADNAVMTNPIPVGAGFWYLARGTNFISRIPRITAR